MRNIEIQTGTSKPPAGSIAPHSEAGFYNHLSTSKGPAESIEPQSICESCNYFEASKGPAARAGMTEAEKRIHARKLNMARRHLTQEQRRTMIREQLAETPERSDRQIAAGLGVNNSTVSRTRKTMEQSGEVLQCDTSIGADSKTYPRQVQRQPVAVLSKE